MMIVKLLIGSVIALALLIGGGVIEVQVHPDQIAQAPGRLLGLVSDKVLLEQGRGFAIHWKRQVEQSFIKDDGDKFKVALGYMQTDAKRLEDLTEKDKQSPEAIVPQANLLNESVEQVRKLGEKAPVSALTAAHDSSKDAFTLAQDSLARLEQLRKDHPEFQAQFERLTASLADNIKEYTGHTPSVAGTQDKSSKAEPTASPTPRPINAVPLQF